MLHKYFKRDHSSCFNNRVKIKISVPEKVYNIQEPEKINPNVVDLDRKSNEDDLWWNQCTLKHLDLSSNVLTEISSDIKNLLDLTVLIVSLPKLTILLLIIRTASR